MIRITKVFSNDISGTAKAGDRNGIAQKSGGGLQDE